MKFIFTLVGPLDESVLASLDAALKTMEELVINSTAVVQRASRRGFFVQRTKAGTITVREERS